LIGNSQNCMIDMVHN